MQVKSNTPPQYADRQHQYTADIRSMFDAQRDYLSTDYVKARVQGLNPNDFYAWTETYIRLSDVSTQSVTAFDSKQYDDFKEILFPDRSIDYIPVGAYVETMGSIWLVVNPSNMGTATANTVIARCRAHYNFYDAYGNILQEPLVVDRRAMLSNRKENPSNIELPEGYFNVKCQINENTMKITDNTRFILGRNAFHVTGLTDFFEEFTFDDESAHIMTFTIRREEPQVNDDMERRIADGLLYNWSGKMNGTAEMVVDGTATFVPVMLLNGDVVEPTEELPQNWTFSSLDPNVVTINKDGVAMGVSQGSASVVATLKENPNITASSLVYVNTQNVGQVTFTNLPPSITQYSEAVITAAFFENGVETDEPLTWQFFGAKPSEYTAEISEDGKSVTISCISASPESLEIRVKHANYMAIGRIKLQGY